jgi:hypothetical protein
LLNSLSPSLHSAVAIQGKTTWLESIFVANGCYGTRSFWIYTNGDNY